MKKRAVLILVMVGLAFLLGVVYVQRRPGSLPPPSQAPEPLTYRGVAPGRSSSADAQNILGAPAREEVSAGATEFVYPSAVEGRPLLVSLDPQGVVSLVIEPLPPGSRFSDLGSSLGQPDAVLYGAYARYGFQLYVYLVHGVALLANPDTGQARERWYYPPTTLNNFQTNFAQGFQTEPIPEGD